MVDFEVLSLDDEEKWNLLIQKLPIDQQDVYFTPTYYQLYENLGDGKAQCFVFEKDGDIVLYPFLKNSINNLGYQLDNEYYDIQGAYGYNGIITSTNDKQFMHAFHLCFDNYCLKNNIVAEFIRFHPLLSNHIFASENTQVLFDRKTVYFDLSKNIKDIYSDFQHSTKKQIRRAENRYHIKVEVYTKPSDYVDVLVDIYTKTMERVNAVPYLFFNKTYFSNLLHMENIVLFVAYHETNPIACISAFYDKDYFHGHLGGSLYEYLNMYPNDLLYKEMIRYAQKINCKFLHIGGGDTPDPDNSLLKFKMNFSNSLADFHIGKKIHKQTVYENIVGQWKNKHPLSYEKNKMKLLGYREI